MIPLALILLLAGGSRVVIDDTIEVPAAEWRYVDIAAKEPNAVVSCEYEVVSPKAEARLVWIARKDLDLFRSGERQRILAASAFGSDGALRQVAPAAGDYAVVVENLPTSHAPAKVRLKVWLRSAVNPQYASPERRLVVILLSCIAFLGMVTFSAYKLSGK
jgi:hypothetical protein